MKILFLHEQLPLEPGNEKIDEHSRDVYRSRPLQLGRERMLHGKITTKHVYNKSYRTVKQGLINTLDAERIGIASIMVKKQHGWEILNVLEQQGASTRTYLIWMSEP